MSVRVYDLAHARAGDKGNTSNISVICYDAKHWDFLERELTPERVADAFKHIAKGPVRRYRRREVRTRPALRARLWPQRSNRRSTLRCEADANHH